jgi:ankyrin repeat protein
MNINNQFDIDRNIEYWCTAGIKSAGFTHAMKLVLSTNAHPEYLQLLQTMLPTCLNDINTEGFTLLHLACANSNTVSTMSTVSMLIEANINVNAQTINGSTALNFAVQYCNTSSNIETVKLLLDANADVNLNDQTPLHEACSNAKTIGIDCIKLLLDANADVNKQNYDGYTAIYHAVKYCNKSSNIEIVKLLLDANTDVNLCIDIPPLYIACLHAKTVGIDCIKLLLDANADVNKPCKNNLTSLHAVSSFTSTISDLSVLKLLLDANADIETSYIYSPLYYACSRFGKTSNIETIYTLINAGANVNKVSQELPNNQLLQYLSYANQLKVKKSN